MGNDPSHNAPPPVADFHNLTAEAFAALASEAGERIRTRFPRTVTRNWSWWLETLDREIELIIEQREAAALAPKREPRFGDPHPIEKPMADYQALRDLGYLESVRSGLVVEEAEGDPPCECSTGSARWCSVHGECTCPRTADGSWVEESASPFGALMVRHDPACPLLGHGAEQPA